MGDGIVEVRLRGWGHDQVLLATQSTALLDHFEPSEVIVVEREGGSSRLRRLDKGSLEDWLDQCSLSELFENGHNSIRPLWPPERLPTASKHVSWNAP